MFADLLVDRVEAVRSVLCVGLDPRAVPDACLRGLASSRSGRARASRRYCAGVIEAVAPYAAAVKPQVAFFERYGSAGFAALEEVMAAARAAGLIVIADAKRGDIASTAEAYAGAWLLPRAPGEPAVAEALTVNPYLGGDSLEPFVRACAEGGGGLFVLARTSNPGGADLQELELAAGGRVWERTAQLIATAGAGLVGRAGLSSIGAVVGVTQPAAVERARALMPHAPLLLPGLGAQGGAAADAAPAFAPHPAGGIVVAARSADQAWRGEAGDWQAHVAAAARAHRDALAAVAFAGDR